MPRNVNPVGPRRRDEREYERRIRDRVLDRFMRQLRAGLTRAAAASRVLEIIEGVFRGSWAVGGLVEDEVGRQGARLAGYHRDRLIQTFRAALGIDIRPVLSDAAIEPLMAAWRRENVRLIRTIPQRFHDSLYRRVSETFAERPFDQRALSKVLNREYRTAGYNLRRLTRDQTSKAIGQLTQARHRQLGITEYTWRTAQDERVRDTHALLDGSTQRWDTPTAVGHPGQDIQCRCVAIPVIEAVRRRGVPSVRSRRIQQPALAEFVPGRMEERGLGPLYRVETDSLVETLQGADPRSPEGRTRISEFLLERGRFDGNEHMVLVDLADGSIHAGTSGLPDGVELVGSIADMLRTSTRRIALYHNHPVSSGLSGADIRVLGTYRVVDRVEAFSPNGAISVARLPARIQGSSAHGSREFWNSAVLEADVVVSREHRARVLDGRMTSEVSRVTHSDTVNRVLAEAGAIEYTTTHAPAIEDVTGLVSRRLRTLIGGVR